MLFNSFEFLVFLPIVFILYWFVCNRSIKLQNVLILVASYFFYGWWSPKFLALLVLSTFLDYLYGFGVASTNKTRAKFFLWLSVVNNLGILAVFKYYNFFVEQVYQALTLAGIHATPSFLHLVLPIGISFYTFHGMSYVFDIHRGKQQPIRDFVDYAVFVCFFPLLVAGPIERASHLLPQVQNKRVFNYKQAVDGCRLILWGLFKKIVIADTIAKTVDLAFANYTTYNAPDLILGAIIFSFQIYCDFSGYSDIALGTAKLFGFELLSNFKFPYFSRDVAEFWRRWHISLSSWFRDYLYIPLGGSREGSGKAVRNTFIIFVVSGFWHGANWTYIVWGFLHACGFLPLLLSGSNRRHSVDVVAFDRKLPRFREVLQMLGTFTFVTLAWIFFRADTIATAVQYISRIISDATHHPKNFLRVIKGIVRGECSDSILALLYIIPLLIIEWRFRRDERSLLMPAIPGSPVLSKVLRYVFYWSLVLIIIWHFSFSENSFIYFQF